MKIGEIILLRSVILFFFTLILTKSMGTKSLSKISPFNFICYSVMAIIASLISLNIITNFFYGIIALLVWSLFSLALDYLSFKNKFFGDIINGKNRMVIKNGKIMEENLTKVRLTGDQLLKEMRSKNIYNIADVEFAVMETSGEINIGLKSDKNPVTPYDLGIHLSPKSEPQTVIMDGKMVDEGLTNIGLNENWLNTQLNGLSVSLDNIFLAQVDSSFNLYLDFFDDKLDISLPKVKELLYANLQKVQSDLISFSLEADNSQIKAMYLHNAKKLDEVISKLEPYLLR